MNTNLNSFVKYLENTPDEYLIQVCVSNPRMMIYICLGYAIEYQLVVEEKKDLASLK
jgi:hypothetical protein